MKTINENELDNYMDTVLSQEENNLYETTATSLKQIQKEKENQAIQEEKLNEIVNNIKTENTTIKSTTEKNLIKYSETIKSQEKQEKKLTTITLDIRDIKNQQVLSNKKLESTYKTTNENNEYLIYLAETIGELKTSNKKLETSNKKLENSNKKLETKLDLVLELLEEQKVIKPKKSFFNRIFGV